MRRLPVGLQVLVFTAGAGLLATLAASLLALRSAELVWTPLLLFVPVALMELLRVDFFPAARDQRSTFTLGSLGLFLLLYLGGPHWAALAAAFQGLLTSLRLRNRWFQAVYNTGIITSAVWVIGLGTTWLQANRTPVWLQFVLVVPLIAAYVGANTGSVALAISMNTRRPMLAVWREHFAWIALQEFVLSVTGFAIGAALDKIGWFALFLASPLLLLRASYERYLSSQTEHTRELEHFAGQLITTLAAVVDARDAYTFGHSDQVARYSVAIGSQLGYSPEEVERLRVGAILHDIGKVGIPEAILFKPGKLLPAEYDLMKRHAEIGYRIVNRIERLAFAADIIRSHHEWFGGGGYPRGQQGEEILLDARIVAVSDALESMISDRPYRKGRTLDEALAEIRRCAGTQFDPQVVTALEEVVRRNGHSFFVNSALLVDETHAGVVAAVGRKDYEATAAAGVQPGGAD